MLYPVTLRIFYGIVLLFWITINATQQFKQTFKQHLSKKRYKYIVKNNLLYSKQFGSQEVDSTKHTKVRLINQITDSVESSNFTLRVLIDLSKFLTWLNIK